MQDISVVLTRLQPRAVLRDSFNLIVMQISDIYTTPSCHTTRSNFSELHRTGPPLSAP